MNNIKDLFDKKFNKQNNYNLIMNKINRRKQYKYVLAIVPIFIFTIFLYNSFNNTNKLENDTEKDIIEFNNIINFNNVFDKTTMSLEINDIAARKIGININDIINKYPILNKLKKIEEFNLSNVYELYDELNPEKENYSTIRGYYLGYQSLENKSMSIYISSDVQMRDRCMKLELNNLEESIINNKKVKLVKYAEGYIALFKINELYFDVEAYNLKEQEFLDIIYEIVR